MTQALNRWLPPLTLAVWGSILLYFFLSGRISSFLHPNFRPGVLIAGVILVLLAGISAIGGGGAECCNEDEACGHSVGRFTWGKLLTFATLLLPLTLAFFASQDGFGMGAIMNRGVVTDVSELRGRGNIPAIDSFMPKTADGQVQVSVMDLLYAAQDPILRDQLNGREVEVLGQLMEEKDANPNGNRMKLVRMYMNCCAADAKPVGAVIELSTPTTLPQLSWVRVIGRISFPMVGGRPMTLLKVASMEPTASPDEAMLY